MTNKEAAEYIKVHCNPDLAQKTQWDIAMTMAVKALEQIGNKDTISRRAAIDLIDEYMDKSIELHYLPTGEDIKDLIFALPSAQQWVPCSKRFPEEHESIWAKLKGTDRWSESMWEK